MSKKSSPAKWWWLNMADIWKTVVLKSIKDFESKYKPGTRYQIRVVQKIKNGVHAAIKVQVGEQYIKAATGETAFKATDMGLEDIKKIIAALPEIEQLFNHPPAVPSEEQKSPNDIDF